MKMWNKPDVGKTVMSEYCVHCPTSRPLPSLPACLITSQLPDFTQHSGLREEELKPLLSRTSTLRVLFNKTMQQRQLLHASTRKLQIDMKDNMQRYKSEKAKLQQQLASLRSQLEDYHLDSSRSNAKSDKAALLDRASHQRHSSHHTLQSFARTNNRRTGQVGYNQPRSRVPLQSISDRSSNRKPSCKPFLTERPHYLPGLDQAVVSRATKKLEWHSGHNLGGDTFKLPPLSSTVSVQQPTKVCRSPESRHDSKSPDTLVTVSTPDIMTSDSRQDLETRTFTTQASKQAKVIDDKTHANDASLTANFPLVPKLSLPSESDSSPRGMDSPEGRTSEISNAANHNTRQPPAVGLERKKKRSRQNRPSGLMNMPITSKKKNRLSDTKAMQSNSSNILMPTKSMKSADDPETMKQGDGSCDTLKLPSITLRPASKTGELERLRSILSMENRTPENNKDALKQKDPTMRWKALYLKIMNPQERSEMLADIMFAVRAKMRENEHQLKFGENPEDLITHNTLCDFLLYKPQKQATNKIKKQKPRTIPHHTAIRSSRKSHAAQLQEYLRNSVRNRPMIEHLQAEEYRLMRYGKHRYLLHDL